MSTRVGETRGAGGTSEPSAEYLRRRLRIALAKARTAAGLTQKATADALDWSTSKVTRIEQGVVPVSPSDVRVLLAVYGMADADRVDELVSLARQAREAKSWAEYDDLISQPFRELIGQEQSAARIWKYEPLTVPGYFQTGAYTRALFAALGQVGSEADRRAEIRAKRQFILELDPGPEMNVVIGEAALVRPVGDTATMREQLNQLIDFSSRPNIRLFMLPFSAGAHPGMGEAFTVLQFDDEDVDDSLYLNDAERRSTSRDEPAEIDRYLQRYNLLQDMALATGTFEQHAAQILERLYSNG